MFITCRKGGKTGHYGHTLPSVGAPGGGAGPGVVACIWQGHSAPQRVPALAGGGRRAAVGPPNQHFSPSEPPQGRTKPRPMQGQGLGGGCVAAAGGGVGSFHPRSPCWGPKQAPQSELTFL